MVDWLIDGASEAPRPIVGGCLDQRRAEAGWAGLKPLVVSHEVVGVGAFDWPGTRDFSPWLSVTEALAFYDELGGAAVREHNRALALEGGRALAEAWGRQRRPLRA